MRTKSLLLLMLALGCGLVASIGITQVMAKRNAGAPAAVDDTVTIFVALEDIPTGNQVTAEALKLEPWPKDKIPPGALMKIEEVEGRRAKSKIYAGSPLLDNQLLSKGVSQGGAGTQVPPGYRVVSVRVDNESGASNLIRPKDRVDLLLYMQRNPTRGIMDTCTRTVLQDIQVFAINDVFNLEDTEGEQTINAKTVSLLVTPGQAETVTLAKELGKIQLAIRSHEDQQEAEVDGAFPHEFDTYLVGDRSKEELPQARPPARGDKRDGFLDLLNSQAVEPEPVQIAQAANDWTMRIIASDEVNDVVLATPASPATPGASSGFSFWKLVTGSRGRGAEAAPQAAPDPAPPAGGDGSQPEPTAGDSPGDGAGADD